MDIFCKLVIIILLLIGNTVFGAGSITVDQEHNNHKITGARVVPRVIAITSSATPTINTNNADAVTITALATAITSMSSGLSGAPDNFQKLIFRFKDDGTPHSIGWGPSFVSSQATLPTTTVAGKVTTVGVMWDSVKGKWVCLAVDQEP